MQHRPKPSAVIFAKDVSRLAHFYKGVIGLKEIHGDKDKVVLDEQGFQLVIHGIPEKIAAQIEISDPPHVRENTPIKVCLPVSHLEEARSKAAELGGKIGAKNKQWEGRGFRACDGYDPEGNVFQVRESTA